jgi:hypothetical protein
LALVQESPTPVAQFPFSAHAGCPPGANETQHSSVSGKQFSVPQGMSEPIGTGATSRPASRLEDPSACDPSPPALASFTPPPSKTTP